MIYLIVYIVFINLITFILMWYDKNQAKKRAYRISEKNIFIFSLLLGGLGTLVGMYKFHHKTKHYKFTIGIPIIIILNIIFIIYLFRILI